MESKGGFLISQIKHTSDRVSEKALHEQGLGDFNGAQGKLLYVLWQTEGISSAELADKAGLAPTTLTAMLDRMEQSGLVKRIPHETDRRRLRIMLTEKSKQLKTQYREYSDSMTRAYYRGFSEREIEKFEKLLMRVLDNLKECEKNGKIPEHL
ncbi:MAG: MarR family transcriptional regulator [Oscillospiraceae bacterium]|nr:MarR family transcriptional regulator [Oscillospiraceae bacterium]